MHNQPVYDIAEICVRKGVEHAMLCPGSRCAPLTLAFTRHHAIRCHTFSDERSAAFIALGLAQQTKKPVALVCTSGTAAYNFAPAVAEAFFSETPLLVITADRPAEWIAQHDGQTIYQANLYGRHAKQSFTLPQHYDHPDDQWHINRIINEAINLANQHPKGPVHINAPFREPFYPNPDEPFSYSTDVRIIEVDNPVRFPLESQIKLAESLAAYRHILIVAGQLEHDKDLISELQITATRVPVVGGILSNLHEVDPVIRYADAFLSVSPDKLISDLKPDLLITFGKSVISKSLKLFLRRFPDIAHWHIQAHPNATDPFRNLSRILATDPVNFFRFLNAANLNTSTKYFERWKTEERRISKAIAGFFPQPEPGELELVHQTITGLPSPCNLHLANSMSVRYAEYIGLQAHHKDIHVFSNRGTSGIDGCTSTAVGHSLSSQTLNILITGDLAFFYDRNAFWHNYPLPNLRIILLNNHGGIIFKLIDGPAQLAEADEYFVTRQSLTAKNLCAEFGFDYLAAKPSRTLSGVLTEFFSPGTTVKVLELEGTIELNKTIFDKFKKKITLHHEA